MVFEDPPEAGGVGAAPPCECLASSRAVAVTGTLEQVDACEATVRVIDVVAGEDREPVRAGDVLRGSPLGCSQQAPLRAGDAVLALYAPLDPPEGPAPIDGPIETPPQLFLAPLGAPIRVEGTDRDLPDELGDALAVLLDLDVCKQWAADHELPREQSDAEDVAGEVDPDAVIVAAGVDGGMSAFAPDEEEEEPPACGL